MWLRSSLQGQKGQAGGTAYAIPLRELDRDAAGIAEALLKQGGGQGVLDLAPQHPPQRPGPVLRFVSLFRQGGHHGLLDRQGEVLLPEQAGQLGQLSEREVRDLITYLMTPGQTPLP